MNKRLFFFLVPLSNWLLGYDRYARSWDKSAIPANRFPNDSYVLAEDDEEGLALVLEKTQSLIDRLGVAGDRIVRIGVELPVDGEFRAELNTTTGTGIGWRWPSPVLKVNSLALLEHDQFVSMLPEQITALAFFLQLRELKNWEQCQARSFSVLPIAQACNARCAFCFSKASVSDSILPNKLDQATITLWAEKARRAGASRAVITGGGEPTLLRQDLLIELMNILGNTFPYTLMISNGSVVEKWAMKQGMDFALEQTKAWKKAGLSRLAISRHGVDLSSDEKIMGLAVDTPLVMGIVAQAGIPLRLICVLQKGGVDSPEGVKRFLERAAEDGADQVCFKELYVSSLSENPWASSKENIYCQANQVPLDMVIETLGQLGFVQVDTLPWGSPCFEGTVQGRRLCVAAYTEPSVGWERHNGIVRSWNLMSDGTCMASLEDPNSVLGDDCEF